MHSLLRRATLAWLTTLTSGLVLAGPASAEKTTTNQALAAHAEWLPYAPPPENGAAAVCLVDTGVDLNPDTASNVVARFALDGGDTGDLSESKHGTEMAMVMGAPANDWGIIGVWPRTRIVSIAMGSDPAGISSFQAYRNGIERCLQRAELDHILVIVLPRAGEPPRTATEQQQLTDTLSRARDREINVLAAAGNTGGPVQSPSSHPLITAVGATNRTGSICPFSARGSDVDLYAPGCALDTADPVTGAPSASSGTSQASVIAAGLVAALRSYDPQTRADDAVARIRSGEVPGLDMRSAFAAAGLGELQGAALRRLRTVTARAADSPQPIVRINRKHSHLLLVLVNRPPRAAVIVRHFRGSSRYFKRRADRVVLDQSFSRVCVQFARTDAPMTCTRV
jgi:subtilisin family serine protease